MSYWNQPPAHYKNYKNNNYKKEKKELTKKEKEELGLKLSKISKKLNSKEAKENAKKYLPKSLSHKYQVFIDAAISYLSVNFKVLKCTEVSIINAIRNSMNDGLLIDGKQAYIAPRLNKELGVTIAIYDAMIQGINLLLMSSNNIKYIKSEPYFKGDHLFKICTDKGGDYVMHTPEMDESKRGEPLGVYTYLITKDNIGFTEKIPYKEILHIQSKAENKNIWNSPFKYEMWKKSCVRRLFKRVKIDDRIRTVLERGDELFKFNNVKKDGIPVPKIKQLPVNKVENETQDKINKIQSEFDKYNETTVELIDQKPIGGNY